MFGVHFGPIILKTKIKSKKDPVERVTLLSQMAYRMILCNQFQVSQKC